MSYHVMYRKPEFQKGWPWSEYLRTATDVVDFIDDLGPDYECRVFEEIDVSDIQEMALEEEEGEINEV